MANEDQLKILRQGVEAWNKWRRENPDDRVDLIGADLRKADLVGADLHKADLRGADLRKADLIGADLVRAKLSWAILIGTVFTEADLRGTDLHKAKLIGADFSGANLYEANLHKADLIGAVFTEANITDTDLSEADLTRTSFIKTTIVRTKLTGCRVYGISAWGLELDDETDQKDLVITHDDEPTVTVDNIEIAQFVYLLLRNEKIRNIIDTIAKKAILILGRFNPPERKDVLNALRDGLREHNYLPIVFDFEKPTERDFTETIKILAGMSLFVIADITNPRSSPLELQATVPDYMIPFVPIIQKDEEPFAMFGDLRKHKWVLETLVYDSCDELMSVLDCAIIEPALQVHDKLMEEKASEPTYRLASQYRKIEPTKGP